MIIGYGFGDDHINKLISDTWQSTRAFSIYYVHPDGRDAVHQGRQHKTLIGYSAPPISHVACIGESRRPLTITFGEDNLEYEKLMRFLLESKCLHSPTIRLRSSAPPKWRLRVVCLLHLAR
jgi:hypothetical protein